MTTAYVTIGFRCCRITAMLEYFANGMIRVETEKAGQAIVHPREIYFR